MGNRSLDAFARQVKQAGTGSVGHGTTLADATALLTRNDDAANDCHLLKGRNAKPLRRATRLSTRLRMLPRR